MKAIIPSLLVAVAGSLLSTAVFAASLNNRSLAKVPVH